MTASEIREIAQSNNTKFDSFMSYVEKDIKASASVGLFEIVYERDMIEQQLKVPQAVYNAVFSNLSRLGFVVKYEFKTIITSWY